MASHANQAFPADETPAWESREAEGEGLSSPEYLAKEENFSWKRWQRSGKGSTASSAHYHGYIAGYMRGWDDRERKEELDEPDSW